MVNSLAQDDPAGRAMFHVQAGRLHGQIGEGEPCHLRVPSRDGLGLIKQAAKGFSELALRRHRPISAVQAVRLLFPTVSWDA
jgi:hypothetical protein